MALPAEKLATALEHLKAIQDTGRCAIRSSDLTRTTRETLQQNRFLQEVMKGWYIAADPSSRDGETTTWFTSFWNFARDYLNKRFGTDWSLSPEQSLILHAGNLNVPYQLLVRANGARNQSTQLLHGTSLFEGNHSLPAADDVAMVSGMRVFRPEAALIAAGPAFFQHHAAEARIVLATQRDASALLERLLAGGHSTIAGRLAGAFRNIGRPREADDILTTMHAAGYDVREADPFADQIAVPYRRDPSPYVHRIRLMWQTMRTHIVGKLPAPSQRTDDIDSYMRQVDEIYVTDAYHSLSIEGYQVSAALIEHVRSGTWRPDESEADREHKNALAARGYWQAFQSVKMSVRDVLSGSSLGAVADRDHNKWRRELFTPSVAVGLIQPQNLAGYRTGPVYIRGSRHTPLNPEAVRDAMPVFFELLEAEPDPAVRIVLGHFLFVYIHPYSDGNGRTARFLMNLMIAGSGHPWTVIPVQSRATYMSALEKASVEQNIEPFSSFLLGLIGQEAPQTA
ncbi:MAG: Fic family protein [Chitinophagaceae bacterium]|nr:MAG: Fic family protein [Chitinophagaceae bacterium]